jgi:predicted ATPase/DNA-binding winged helix-turn-helix (wHTH) protein
MPLSTSTTPREFAFGRCLIQPAARQLWVNGAPTRLGARAFDVLMALVDRRQAVVSKNELMDIVWPDAVVEENNLQVHVSTLRKLLGPQTIVTVPGRGYRFIDAPSVVGARPPKATETSTVPALTNLPVHLPPLFGRHAELAALSLMLGPDASHRLITVTGAGGMGKTRLAMAAARVAQGETASYPDGVWLVELAAISAMADGALVMASVARALGITLGAGDGEHNLAGRIADRRMLIVLDNCEHVIDCVASLAAALLARAPEVRLLATSQELLKLPEEQVFRLGTLSVPADEPADRPDERAELTDAQHFGALALFVDRARAVLPHFVVSHENLPSIIDICRRLDGIPLAIEFAAARLPLLGLEGLRGKLDDRFRLLTGGSRLAPKRQQTMRAALEWSHALLDDNEQRVLRRLAIFSGSFGLEGAQAVASDTTLDAVSVLDHLDALVDKSLVIAETGPVPRYRLLESTRIFALEQLHSAQESLQCTKALAAALLEKFEVAYRSQWHVTDDALIERMLPNIGNLRVALHFNAGPQGDATAFAALAGASGWLWRPANLTIEGVQWCDRAVARLSSTTPPAIEARLLLAHATLAHQADANAELLALTRAAVLFQSVGDRQGQYEALVLLAQKQVWARDLAAAQQSIEQADPLFDPAWPAALREGHLAARTYLCEVTGRAADGQPLMEQLVAIMRATGDVRKLDFALMQLAENLFIQGKVHEAIAARLEIKARIGERRVSYAGTNLGNLCAALVFVDQLDAALEVGHAAFAPLQRAGLLRLYADHFALLAFKLGQHHAAARLLGRCNANYAASGFEREESELRASRMTADGLAAALPADALQLLLAEGAGLTDEAVIRVALVSRPV